MYDLNQNWFFHWLKQPILTTIRLCREWIGQQQKQLKPKDSQATLSKLDQQFAQLEQAAFISYDPFSLYHWLNNIINAQKQLIRCMKTEPVYSPLLTSYPEPDDEQILSEPSPDRLREPPVPIGKHKLPPLPYPYDALEPYIDEQTIRIHHDEHHQSYVDGLNKAEKMLQLARQNGDFDLIKNWERELAFNGAGHYLHTLFWEIMSPQGGGEPTGSLYDEMQRDFGSFEAFKKQFSAAAEKVEGGGWAILVWSPRSHRLEILQAEKHQNLSQWDVIPILAIDVWEHAYYLKYPNKRKDYIAAWWNVVNWPKVQKRWKIARQVIWKPY